MCQWCDEEVVVVDVGVVVDDVWWPLSWRHWLASSSWLGLSVGTHQGSTMGTAAGRIVVGRK